MQTDIFGNELDEKRKSPCGKYWIRDGISNAGLNHFQSIYDEKISKEDLFYYIYGLLQSEEYKTRYADNLSKELPRIPRMRKMADFWHFSKAGRALADLHIDYEKVAMYPVKFLEGSMNMLGDCYRVKQMKFRKNGKEKDKTTVIYNEKITVTGIPLEAYEYVVNGKSAIEWVIDQQCISTHKDSGIVNDANDYAIETMQNPRYCLEILLRVITVSLETMKIVKSLPKLDIYYVD